MSSYCCNQKVKQQELWQLDLHAQVIVRTKGACWLRKLCFKSSVLVAAGLSSETRGVLLSKMKLDCSARPRLVFAGSPVANSTPHIGLIRTVCSSGTHLKMCIAVHSDRG